MAQDTPSRAEPAYVSIRSLATYSGLSVRTLRTYLVHPLHPLPCFRVGGKVLVRLADFDAWVTRFRSMPASEGTVDALVAETMRGL